MKLLGAGNTEAVQKLLLEQFAATISESGGPPVLPVERHVELAKTLRDEHAYAIFRFCGCGALSGGFQGARR